MRPGRVLVTSFWRSAPDEPHFLAGRGQVRGSRGGKTTEPQGTEAAQGAALVVVNCSVKVQPSHSALTFRRHTFRPHIG